MPYIIHTHEQNGQTISATFSLQEHDAVFSGHFPGRPVLPGVIQMRLIAELVGRAAGSRATLKEAASVKFLSPIIPGLHERYEVHISYQVEDALVKADAQIGSGGQSFMKMKSVFSLD